MTTAVEVLETGDAAGLPVGELLTRTRSRADNAARFAEAYRRYAWSVDGLEGVRLALFQLLASDVGTYEDRSHLWHLNVAGRPAGADSTGVLQTPRHILVDTEDVASVADGVAWWEALTAAGGEGMVVKPLVNLDPVRRRLA